MAKERFRDYFLGLDTPTPRLNGKVDRYINLDNAASTPPLQAVQGKVSQFLPLYSSVHRGTGFKSQLSTHIFEESRAILLEFVGAHPEDHVCIFGKNTTEALNKLALRFPFSEDRNLVLTSGMEHHSNDLPWRGNGQVVHVGLLPDGRLDEADFDAKLNLYGRQVALVAITGASNVTGFLNPIHRLAEKAHAAGAQIVVDCAQLAPHRKLNMRRLDDPAHLDYVALSAHKMYAPFGTGALVGRRDTFSQGEPDYRGGGTVDIVTLDHVTWAGPPDRDEAGSPNTVGAMAMATSARFLMEIGMDRVAAHEAELTAMALEHLSSMNKAQIFGDPDPRRASERLGVIPFNLSGLSHFLVAAILGHEFGIGVRSGCFCAHPYVLHLLRLSEEEAMEVRRNMEAGDRSSMPGMVRASFGLYNSEEDIQALMQALEKISEGDYQGQYTQDRASGEFTPVGWSPQFERYFSFRG